MKQFTNLRQLGEALLAVVLFLLCSVSCANSDDDVYEPEGRFVSGVVVPTSMNVYRGMEVALSGKGFEDGDALFLRADKDLAVTKTVSSAKSFAFQIPDQVTTATNYKFVLSRGGQTQVLGASRLEVLLAVGVEIPASISSSFGFEETIAGEGFREGDKLFFEQEGDKVNGVPTIVRIEAEVLSSTHELLTYKMPETVKDGACKLVLEREGEKQLLGETKLFVSFSADVPDKDGATIKGIVYCEKAGVANVLVSDGELITKTDEKGFFWLESSKSNGLVFVITPSGHEVPTKEAMPQFWYPTKAAAGKVEQHNFELVKSQNDKHTMVVATDMHLANRNTPKDYTQFANGFVAEVKAAYNDTPGKTYCLNLGDFSWDQYWYENRYSLVDCKATVKDFKFQFWSAMGNHDNNPFTVGDFKAEIPYRQILGPVYYSMNIGKVHYIMVDNTEYLNAGASEGVVGSRDYNRRLVASNLAWLKEDLKYVDKSTPIVIGMHCPVYTYSGISSTTNKYNVSTALSTAADVSNLISCFDGFEQVHILTGHTHVNRNIAVPGNEGRIMEHNVTAVSATWWWTDQYAKINVSTDGSPAGYKVFEADGKNLKWYFKGVGLPKERQFTSYDMNKVLEYWKGDEKALKFFTYTPSRAKDYDGVSANTVYINVWGYEPDSWTVSVTEGGTPLEVKHVWKRDPLHSASYDIPRGAANNGSLTFPSTTCMHMLAVQASSAASTLEITVTDRFGNRYTETMSRPKNFPSKY